jgi:SAM-dependent methyltransferase
MSSGIFSSLVAAHYDESCGEMNSNAVLDPTVDVLHELSNGGRALEFAIGTGRVALPLSARGVSVVGIELSQPMLDEMMAKSGASVIPVVLGDMATTRVEGPFSLVYLVYNTITNLLTQDQQVQCFRNAAAHLSPGGHFVIEVFVPALQRLPQGETFLPFDVSPDHVGIDEYDVVNQLLISHHYWIATGATFDSPHRYAWPAEYDLMASMTGFTLAHRWANWEREPFTNRSTSHISVWQKTAD